jgi:hypothetical protein
LSKNWPSPFQQNFQQPETVADAVDRLMMILDGEQKIALVAMAQEDLMDLHFSLGAAIRNSFWLHKPGSKLLASCGAFVHPDDASGVIVKALWDKLRGTENSI